MHKGQDQVNMVEVYIHRFWVMLDMSRFGHESLRPDFSVGRFGLFYNL